MGHKPTELENEFFAKEEAERLHQMREEKKRTAKKEAQENAKRSHYMKCPKCGSDLKTIILQTVEIDECRECGAIVLDQGELEKLKSRDHRFFSALMDVFKQSK